MTDNCFNACTSLKSVTFEKGSPIKELSTHFRGCSSLEEVVLPDNLSSIGRDAWSSTFAFCTSLKTITLPKSVTKIKDGAFGGCTALEDINLENITVIGNDEWSNMIGTFAGCESLKAINLEKVENIGEYAFYGCTSLKNINLESTINIYDYAFQKCISLEEVKLDNLEVLGAYAFDSCVSLKQIELPSIKYLGISVEEDDEWWLDGDAFKNCHSLETVVLGSSLLSTNEGDLFNGCNNLKDVYCYAVNPPMDTDWEEGDTDHRTILGDFVLHVPASSIDFIEEGDGQVCQLHLHQVVAVWHRHGGFDIEYHVVVFVNEFFNVARSIPTLPSMSRFKVAVK